MALTINELRRERRSALNGLKRELRNVDSGVERMKRFLNRVLQRTNKIPEAADLDAAYQLYVLIQNELKDVEKSLNDSAVIFTTI